MRPPSTRARNGVVRALRDGVNCAQLHGGGNVVERGRRRFLVAAGGFLALPQSARAQKPPTTARVGWLGWTGGPGTVASAAPLDAFRSGLADRGWQEGRNLVLQTRTGDGAASRALATDLLRSGVDVLVAQGPMVFGARAVAGATPVVFNINGDPVEAKLVASLARPGGTLTGVTALSAGLAGKRIEFLKQTTPGVLRMAALANQSHPGVQTESDASQAAARQLGIALQWYPVYGADDFPAAFEAIARSGAGALVAIPDNLVNQQAKAIAAFSVQRRIPSISGWAEFAEAGNLMSYGPNLRDYYRLLAGYVEDRKSVV